MPIVRNSTQRCNVLTEQINIRCNICRGFHVYSQGEYRPLMPFYELGLTPYANFCGSLAP